jgi:hypothetical protein
MFVVIVVIVIQQNLVLIFNSSPIDFLHRLKSMFELDPLLRRTFLFALPFRDLGPCVRMGCFPPYEVCWTLARKLDAKSYYSEEEVKFYKHH